MNEIGSCKLMGNDEWDLAGDHLVDKVLIIASYLQKLWLKSSFSFLCIPNPLLVMTSLSQERHFRKPFSDFSSISFHPIQTARVSNCLPTMPHFLPKILFAFFFANEE